MKKIFWIALNAVVFLGCGSAHASDEKGLYQTLNFISCPQYAEDRKVPLHSGRNAADEISLSGWLSAYNYLVPNTYDIVPAHDIMKVLEWMDKFCKENPTKNVESGLLQFTSEAYPSRMERFVDPHEIKVRAKEKK